MYGILIILCFILINCLCKKTFFVSSLVVKRAPLSPMNNKEFSNYNNNNMKEIKIRKIEIREERAGKNAKTCWRKLLLCCLSYKTNKEKKEKK